MCSKGIQWYLTHNKSNKFSTAAAESYRKRKYALGFLMPYILLSVLSSEKKTLSLKRCPASGVFFTQENLKKTVQQHSTQSSIVILFV